MSIIRNELKSGKEIYGAYEINITRPTKEESSNKVYNYSKEDINEFKFILGELSQLSKRVEYMEY